ncbi:hypothetical protein TNCV_159871 [Trichonephila clavipes]|uniref:Uncharacterized protein n=1 Tax=Trichonephila clavipes TaxID=2585209 RepID=A0A8X6UYD9_TRICX|nr:hypothetical protein TNCV_159871 [Trichonephila clavipes]
MDVCKCIVPSWHGASRKPSSEIGGRGREIMAASSSSFIPTPLAQADNQGEGHPRGALLQGTSAAIILTT